MDQRAFSYLVGIGVTHSIAPAMHNYIASSLGYNWKFIAQECPTIEDVLRLFRQPTFAGGVVTMPYKTSIMSHLDGIDDTARLIGACNNVYIAQDGLLRGTNTDWRGIHGCLLSAGQAVEGKPGLIIGAGGAARAALYVLSVHLRCNPIYVINRDNDEVAALRRDGEHYGEGLNLIHVLDAVDAAKRTPPHYIVGTVPDFEPQSKAEIDGTAALQQFLSSSQKGVLLDMCFKPRRTRNLKLAEGHGWKTVEGVDIIGYQIEEQYRLWCGEEDGKRLPREGAWKVLHETAERSTAINF